MNGDRGSIRGQLREEIEAVVPTSKSNSGASVALSCLTFLPSSAFGRGSPSSPRVCSVRSFCLRCTTQKPIEVTRCTCRSLGPAQDATT